MVNVNKLVKLYGSSFRGCNTGYVSGILFSIKKRKFIKGKESGRCDWSIEYYILPGTYLRFSWNYWNKEDPSNKIIVELIKVKENGEIEILKSAIWEYNKSSFLKNQILKDFHKATPEYHGPTVLNFDKVYSEEDVNELINMLGDPENPPRYIEGIDIE